MTWVLGPLITVVCAATVVAVTTAWRPTPLLVWNSSELSAPSPASALALAHAVAAWTFQAARVIV